MTILRVLPRRAYHPKHRRSQLFGYARFADPMHTVQVVHETEAHDFPLRIVPCRSEAWHLSGRRQSCAACTSLSMQGAEIPEQNFLQIHRIVFPHGGETVNMEIPHELCNRVLFQLKQSQRRKTCCAITHTGGDEPCFCVYHIYNTPPNLDYLPLIISQTYPRLKKNVK